MPNELANRIEAFLLAAQGWVNAEDLCVAFNVTRRELRARDEQPGLCSSFAISGNQGFRHVKFASDKEFAAALGRIHKHAMSELRRERLLQRKRAATAPPIPPPTDITFDQDQALLLTPP